MIVTKHGRNIIRMAALSAMSLAFSFMTASAPAAELWFDNNGATGGYGTGNNGVYSWDGSVWATASGGTTATAPWVQGSIAAFLASATPITINVGNDEQVAQVQDNETAASITTIIGQTPSTSGDLDIGSAAAGFYITTGTSTLQINAPIVGVGGEVVQHSAGTLALYGVNTFSGGFDATGGQLTYYNNSSSFGTGNILITGGSSNAFLTGTTSQVTIPNNWTLTVVDPLNLVGGNGTIATPGTIFSGNFPVNSGTENFETSGTATNVDEISGVISGVGNVEFSDKGTMVLTGPNNYTGTTTVTSAINGPVTLVLGASGTIASSKEVIMSGGILNPDALNQIMGSTTMALSGTAVTSVIDYGLGAAEIDFANSSAVSWTSGDILNLANFTPGTDFLRFGIDTTGLTSTQLAEIEYDGLAATKGTAVLDTNGYVEFPEPASLSMLGIGALGLLARRRK